MTAKLSARLLLFDGTKALPAWGDSDTGWTILSGGGQPESIDVYFRRVPWLYRGVVDRANNVANLPYRVIRAGQDYDNSATWTNALGFLPNPNLLLKRLEMSLAMTGRAYLFLETNSAGYIKSVKYCSPYSISEQYNQQTGELIGYKRTIGAVAKTIDVPKSNVVAIYDPDYMTEIGPGQSSAAMAALTASGVLYNADRFISDYFRRGAIKATILAVDGGNSAEAERLQSWWQDVVAGIKNAWTAFVVKAQQIKPTIIGEGLESLQNNEMTTERRQDISTALGVPESRMWSSAANYATRLEDEKAYFSGTIIPEAEAIAAAFNEQIFTKDHRLDGYRWEFLPETLDIFQADTAQQAAAAASLVDFIVKSPTKEICIEAARVVGVEMTNEFIAAIEAWFANKDTVPQTETTESEDEPGDEDYSPQETRAALANWKRKALHALARGKSADVDFVTALIPKRTQDMLHYELQGCTTDEQIKNIFDQAMPFDPDAELRRAIAMLERFDHDKAQ